MSGDIVFHAKSMMISTYHDISSPDCIEELLQILFDIPSNQKMKFFELHFLPGSLDYKLAESFNYAVDEFGKMLLSNYLIYRQSNKADKLKAAHVYLDFFSQYVTATLIDENRRITHKLSDTLEKVFPTTLAGFFYGQTLLLQGELSQRIQNPHKALQSTAVLTLMLDEEALHEQDKKYDEYVKTELEDFLKAHEQEQAQIKQLQQQINAMKTNKKKKTKKPSPKIQESPAAAPADKLERKSTAPQILSKEYEQGKQLLMKSEFALARDAYQQAYINAEKQKDDFTKIAAQLEIAECFLSEANLLLLKMKLSHLRGKEEPEVRQINVNQLIYSAHQEAEKALKLYHQCIAQLKQKQQDVVNPLTPDLAAEQELQREMQKIEDIKAPILTFKNRVQRTQEKLSSFIDHVEKQSIKDANELSARLATREKKKKEMGDAWYRGIPEEMVSKNALRTQLLYRREQLANKFKVVTEDGASQLATTLNFFKKLEAPKEGDSKTAVVVHAAPAFFERFFTAYEEQHPSETVEINVEDKSLHDLSMEYALAKLSEWVSKTRGPLNTAAQSERCPADEKSEIAALLSLSD